MKSILQKPKLPRGFIAVLVIFCVYILGITLASHANADSPEPVSGQRLITVYDQGQEHAFLTRAATLRRAFQDAGVRLDPNDLVEPGLDEQLVGASYDVNIYRARPVTIVDGAARVRVLTPYQTAKQIVDHAGMTLHDEDITTMTAASDEVGVQLTIDRATPLTLMLYGKTVTIYTQAKTIAELLKEKGITLAANDTLSAAPATPITANMTLQIWRNGVQTVTQEQDVPFSTRQIQDVNQPIGYHQVQTPGQVGKEEVTYQINMQNGQEVSRTVIQTVVTQQPSEQVEVIGTKVQLPPGSHTDWMAAAGISSGDYGFVDYIASREGGWQPCKVQGGAINCMYATDGGSMGYGIVQATPGIKMSTAGSDWATNPITQLRWATAYAAKYGGWEGAYNHWLEYHSW